MEIFWTVGGMILTGVVLTLWFMWRLGYFATKSDQAVDQEVAQSKIDNRLREIEVRKQAIAAGDLDEPLRPKSRRLRNKRKL